MSDKTVLARFTCSYQLFGDAEGLKWMDLTLNAEREANNIEAYNVLSSETGTWGIQFVLFQVDVMIPPLAVHDAIDYFKPEINHIIGDSDVEILWVSAATK